MSIIYGRVLDNDDGTSSPGNHQIARLLTSPAQALCGELSQGYKQPTPEDFSFFGCSLARLPWA
jgi:hypothetical protein